MTATDASSTRSAEAGSTPRRAARPLARLSTGHLVMLVAGVVAVVANYALLRDGDATVDVLVAAEPIAAGTMLRAELVEVAPAGSAGPALSSLLSADERAQLEGVVAASALEPGEPLRASDLRPVAAEAGLRAMSLPIDAARAAGGALQPGDRVDVIETRDGRARYAATDVEVLAVADRGAMEPLRDFTVTMAVDADTALRLAEAAEQHTLDLVRATGSEPVGAGASR